MLSLNGTWSNSGTITSTNNSTVVLGGTFTLAELGTLDRTGGTVDLTGTLDNTGTTLALDDTTGSWQVLNGTIAGGTVATAGSAELIGAAYGKGTLDGVTVAGTLDMASQFDDAMTVTGGLTLVGGEINLAKAGRLLFSGTQTLGGTGTVTFSDVQGNDGLDVAAASTLSIAPGITIHGTGGYIGPRTPRWAAPSSIRAPSPPMIGGKIYLDGVNWRNTGTIASTSGYIFLVGTLDNRGATRAGRHHRLVLPCLRHDPGRHRVHDRQRSR